MQESVGTQTEQIQMHLVARNVETMTTTQYIHWVITTFLQVTAQTQTNKNDKIAMTTLG